MYGDGTIPGPQLCDGTLGAMNDTAIAAYAASKESKMSQKKIGWQWKCSSKNICGNYEKENETLAGPDNGKAAIAGDTVR